MSDDPAAPGSSVQPAQESARRHANVELRRFQLAGFLGIPIALAVSAAFAWAVFRLPQPVGLIVGLCLLPAILLVLQFLRDASWGIYAIYFLEIFRPQDQWRTLRVIKLSSVLLVVVSAIFLLRFLTVGRRRLVWTAHSSAFLALLAVMGTTVFTAMNTPAAYYNFLTMASVFVIYVLATNLIDTRRKLSTFVRVLMVLYLALTLKGSLGYLREGSVAFSDTVGGFLGDENDFALAVLVFVPFAYYGMLLWRKRALRVLAGALFFVLVLGVVLTFSRGGTVGLGATLVYCFWRSKRRGTVLIGALLLLGILAAVAPADYWKEVSSIKNTNEGTALKRRQLWSAGWRMFLAHPVLGVGLGNSGRLLPDFYRGRNPGTQWNRALHSLYFQALSELGVMGVLAFGWLSWAIRRALAGADRILGLSPEDARERDYLTHSIRAGFVGYLVSAAFLSTLIYPHFYLLTILAALVGILYGGAASPARGSLSSAPLAGGMA